MVGLLMPIGTKLRDLRSAAGMTQQQLATAAGLSMSIVAQIEQGTNLDPRLSTLKALAKALGVSVNEFTGDNGGEPPATSSPRRGRGKGK